MSANDDGSWLFTDWTTYTNDSVSTMRQFEERQKPNRKSLVLLFVIDNTIHQYILKHTFSNNKDNSSLCSFPQHISNPNELPNTKIHFAEPPSRREDDRGTERSLGVVPVERRKERIAEPKDPGMAPMWGAPTLVNRGLCNALPGNYGWPESEEMHSSLVLLVVMFSEGYYSCHVLANFLLWSMRWENMERKKERGQDIKRI